MKIGCSVKDCDNLVFSGSSCLKHTNDPHVKEFFKIRDEKNRKIHELTSSYREEIKKLQKMIWKISYPIDKKFKEDYHDVLQIEKMYDKENEKFKSDRILKDKGGVKLEDIERESENRDKPRRSRHSDVERFRKERRKTLV